MSERQVRMEQGVKEIEKLMRWLRYFIILMIGMMIVQLVEGWIDATQLNVEVTNLWSTPAAMERYLAPIPEALEFGLFGLLAHFVRNALRLGSDILDELLETV